MYGSIPESGRSPGGEHGNALQYSRLENPMDRGAWWPTVYRVANGQMPLKLLNMHTCTCSPLISVIIRNNSKLMTTT